MQAYEKSFRIYNILEHRFLGSVNFHIQIRNYKINQSQITKTHNHTTYMHYVYIIMHIYLMTKYLTLSHKVYQQEAQGTYSWVFPQSGQKDNTPCWWDRLYKAWNLENKLNFSTTLLTEEARSSELNILASPKSPAPALTTHV